MTDTTPSPSIPERVDLLEVDRIIQRIFGDEPEGEP
jgi:hypothetical protein